MTKTAKKARCICGGCRREGSVRVILTCVLMPDVRPTPAALCPKHADEWCEASKRGYSLITTALAWPAEGSR